MKGLERIEETLTRIDEAVSRLVEHAQETCQGWLSIRQAASITGLSTSHVRRAVRRGELAASNVGSGGHAIWRIARADLASWMETKKGGTAVVPPRGQLDGLVDRYFGSGGCRFLSASSAASRTSWPGTCRYRKVVVKVVCPANFCNKCGFMLPANSVSRVCRWL